jgi:hypothetical protein
MVTREEYPTRNDCLDIPLGLHAVEEPHGIPIFRLDCEYTRVLIFWLLVAHRSLDLRSAITLVFPLPLKISEIEVVAAVCALA